MKSHHLSLLSGKSPHNASQLLKELPSRSFSQPCKTIARHPSRGPLTSKQHEKNSAEVEQESTALLSASVFNYICSMCWEMFCINHCTFKFCLVLYYMSDPRKNSCSSDPNKTIKLEVHWKLLSRYINLKPGCINRLHYLKYRYVNMQSFLLYEIKKRHLNGLHYESSL